MKNPWKPTNNPNDERHPASPHHGPHHHRGPTIGTGRPGTPPHVDTHAGLAVVSEHIVVLDDKVDHLTALVERLLADRLPAEPAIGNAN